MEQILFKIPSDKVIPKVHLFKDDDVVVCQSLNKYNELIAAGYQVFEEPDPLFNPNEVTRVSEIMALHRRGITPSYVGQLRNTIVDDRSDEQKINSPNLESDKLYPSFARLSAQNAHYKSTLDSNIQQITKDVEEYNNHVELLNLTQQTDTIK